MKKLIVNSKIRWEVVWRANLKDYENVNVVPFGHEFFIAEGVSIADGVWWDLKNPPNGPDSKPLWKVNDLTTYPKFIFD